MNILEARKKSPVIRRTAWEKDNWVNVERDNATLAVHQIFEDDWEPVYPNATDFVTALHNWTHMRNVHTDFILTVQAGLLKPRAPTWHEATSLWVEHKE